MKRRHFLGGTLGAAAAFSWSRRAAGSDERTPLWLQVHAGGGWDTSLLCDPKQEVNGLNFNTGQTSPTAAGHVFSYADLGGSATGIPSDNGFEFGEFFETWAEQLVVLNGVWTESAGHRSGARLAASGRLMEGYPSLWAMIATHYGAHQSMPYLTGNGAAYSASMGLAPPTRLSDLGDFEQIARPNRVTIHNTETFYSEEEFEWLNAARSARMERLIAKEQRAHVRARLEQIEKSQSGQSDLLAFQDAWATGAATPLPTLNKTNSGAVRLFNSGLQTLIGWELGLTSSGVLGHSGFDTHNRHDASHPNALQNLLLGIHLILQEAETRGVPVVMVVTSEFGRTATYNAADGKDHWPSTSWMLLQTKGLEMFQTGRLFGGSLYDNSVQQIRPMALNMETLAPDEEGSLLNPEALHVWLRGRAGLKDTLMSEHLFPLRNAVWPGLDTLI